MTSSFTCLWNKKWCDFAPKLSWGNEKLQISAFMLSELKDLLNNFGSFIHSSFLGIRNFGTTSIH
jgi:hypothetical protein